METTSTCSSSFVPKFNIQLDKLFIFSYYVFLLFHPVLRMAVSFREFFFDNSIPGHTLLEPFIAVCAIGSRLVSSLPIERHSRIVEIIQRIALGVILPVLGLISVAFVPLGLLLKGCVNLCCPLPRRIPLLRIEMNPPQSQGSFVAHNPQPYGVTPFNEDSVATHTPNPGGEPDLSIGERSEKEIPYDSEALVLMQIKTLLVEASARETDFTKLDEAEDLLKSLGIQGNEDLLTWIQVLRKRVPISNQVPHDSPSPPPSPRGVDFSQITITDSGEASVPSDGDCLFTSFRFQSQMHGSENLGSGDERKDTVEWIRNNYHTNTELQLRLINSLFEHYQGLIDRKREEMPPKQLDESIREELERSALEARIAEEIRTLMINKMDPINKAIASETEKFEKVRHLVPDYLEEMAQPKVFGGSAELYALSFRHRVCVIIHPKKGDLIGSPSKDKINAQFETPDRPARHFTKTANHYNPLIPKKEFLSC